nr:MAG: hypothetical protein 1 [Totiviridae sp.]
MFEFLTQLFPSGTKIPQVFDLKNTYIKYGITTSIKMWLTGGFGKLNDTRRNAFLGNMATLLGRTTCDLISDAGIYDGMCADIMGPDGTPDLGLADELVRKHTIYKPELTSVRAIVESNLTRANIVGPIYNMLRMYIIKAYGHLEYNGDADFYTNGHVKATNIQAFAHAGRGKLRDAISFEDGDLFFSYTKSSFNEYDDTVFYTMGSELSDALATVLRLSHCKWINKLPFLVAHESPALTEKICLVGTKFATKTLTFEDLTLADIKLALADFVRRNSAYRDFEIAYGMLAGVLTKPVPRSAEAIYWSVRVTPINIPKPFCFRGVAPELYSGTSYVRGPEWQDTFFSWFSNPTAVVGHSVAMMEAVYTEMFHLTRLTHYDDIDQFNFMQYATGVTSAPETGYLVDVALTCLRYGREYDARYLTRSGVDRIATLPGLGTVDVNVTVIDPRAGFTYKLGEMIEGRAPLEFSAHAPITYPSLSYGINDDGYYLNGDTEEIEINCAAIDGQIIFSDPAIFSKYMSMMRLFGYDVEAREAGTNRIIHNWADNASGRYIYNHNSNDVAPRFIITQDMIKERANHWIKLPTLVGLIKFGYELGDKALSWFSGEARIGFGQPLATVVKRTEYIQAVAKLTQARPTTKIMPLHKRADFRETRIGPPASRPTLAPTSSAIAGGPLIDTSQASMEDVPADLPQDVPVAN